MSAPLVNRGNSENPQPDPLFTWVIPAWTWYHRIQLVLWYARNTKNVPLLYTHSINSWRLFSYTMFPDKNFQKEFSTGVNNKDLVEELVSQIEEAAAAKKLLLSKATKPDSSSQNVPTSPTSTSPYSFFFPVQISVVHSTSALKPFQLGMGICCHWKSHKWCPNANSSIGEGSGLSSCFILWCLWHSPNHGT